LKTLSKQISGLSAEYLDDTLRFMSDLIRTPSFSSKEKAVIEVIQREMNAVDFDDIYIDGLGSIIGRIGNGPRVIAFDAHIDTVYEGDRSQWSFDPFTPKIEEGKIWGRGTVDQKGGMASMMCAARIIKQLNLQSEFTIYFVGSVMEEDCDGLCWQYILNEEHIRPELVVITEPTDMKLHRGHRGRMEMQVKISGVSCHGSAPERGDNAIYKISRIALEIEKLNEQLASDEFLGKGTVAVTQVTSSSPSQCAVADAASLWLDRRLTAGESKGSAVAEVKAAAKAAGYPNAVVEVPLYNKAGYTGLRYPVEKYYPTWTTPENAPSLLAARRAYSSVLGQEPVVDKWTFSTNAVAISGMHGITCIGLGPGNEIYAHAPNEACPVEHLRDAASFYAAFIAELGGRL
jgi:putative selenium metabolism hydrolase